LPVKLTDFETLYNRNGTKAQKKHPLCFCAAHHPYQTGQISTNTKPAAEKTILQ
jgi:hypothetical protein